MSLFFFFLFFFFFFFVLVCACADRAGHSARDHAAPESPAPVESVIESAREISAFFKPSPEIVVPLRQLGVDDQFIIAVARLTVQWWCEVEHCPSIRR